MRFDDAAATWDESPVRLERARKLADDLRPLIRQHGLRTAIDYGAGTGLVSFHLLDDLQHITLVDLSEGMVREARRKVAEWNVTNMTAVRTDFLEAPFPQQVDLIYILLTLHHILDTRGILQAFYDTLHPGGFCCIADLEEEDGSFHAEFPDFDGHNGFDPEQLKALLEEIGFQEVRSQHFFTLTEEQPEGSRRDYPLFLMTARKPQ